MLFRDENGGVFTADDLRAEFEELKKSGEIETETFDDYLENATSKNGTLTKLQ